MEVRILDYRNRETTVNIGNLDEIYLITMQVVTGDEELTVIYNDGSMKHFDASSELKEEHIDEYYIVYMPYIRNFLTDENWINRKSSDDLEFMQQYARWIDYGVHLYKCSACEKLCNCRSNYCMNCGCKMTNNS